MHCAAPLSSRLLVCAPYGVSMGDSAAPDVSEAAAAQAAAPVYVHKLSDHQVQGDATFKEINDFQTPYEGGAEKAQR